MVFFQIEKLVHVILHLTVAMRLRLCSVIKAFHYHLQFISTAFPKQKRSSRPEMFCKKGVLRNFAKFTGKHLCQSLFLNKVVGLRPVLLKKLDVENGDWFSSESNCRSVFRTYQTFINEEPFWQK